MRNVFSVRSPLGFFGLLFLIILIPAGFCSAQDRKKDAADATPGENVSLLSSRFKAWEIDDTQAARKTDIVNAFKSGTAIQDRDVFFDKFYFARWTDPANMGEVQNFVSEMFNRDFKDASGSARDYFLTKSFEVLRRMVADQTVNPTARYNAMLAIGQLVQREGGRSNEPPIAYAPALAYLVGEYNKESNPDYLRFGAMIGIVRHAAMGIADATARNTTVPQLFMKVIAAGKPVAGRNKDDQEILDWTRMRALEGLAFLRTANPDVFKTIFEVADNPQESYEMQTRAVRVLGDLDLKNIPQMENPVDFALLANNLLILAKKYADGEIQTLNELISKEKITGTGLQGRSGFNPGAMSRRPVRPGAAATLDTGPPYERLEPEQQIQVQSVFERIKFNFGNILYGIRGPGNRFARATNFGVRERLPDDNPIVKKLDNFGVELEKFFGVLEKGVPEERKSATTSGREGSQDSEKGKTDSKMLQVNLGDILEELKLFGDELEGILNKS